MIVNYKYCIVHTVDFIDVVAPGLGSYGVILNYTRENYNMLLSYAHKNSCSELFSHL